MRVSMTVGCVLVFGSAVGWAADTDGASVRDHSGRYTSAILKKDIAGLFALLHQDYRGENLPGTGSRPDVGKRQAVAYWADDGLMFTSFEVRVERVRLFGDTAIETGSFAGTSRHRGTTNFYGGLHYTRVWVRDGQGWRLAHERY